MLLGAPPLAVVAMCCLLVSAHNQRQKMPPAAVGTMLLHQHIQSQPGIPLGNETNDSSIPAPESKSVRLSLRPFFRNSSSFMMMMMIGK